MENQSELLRLKRLLHAHRMIARWVACKLEQLERLEPHEWDRSTLRELRNALLNNPKLRKDQNA